VYVACKDDPACRYLLKTVRQNRQVRYKKRFYGEINTVSSFDHPNIARPVDARFEGDSFYLIYQYEDGLTLKELFDANGVLEEKKALAIIKQLLEALTYIHARGVIHADINPNNVFVTNNGGCKLIDFGYSLNAEDVSKVENDQIIGTFPYLSPEQMGFTNFSIDNRTDTYCVAILLYQALAGALPFPMKDDSLKHLLDASIKRGIQGLKHIPQFLNEILLKGLKPTPCDRYQTADGMLHDILASMDAISRDGNPVFVAGKKDAILSINRKRMFVVRQHEISRLSAGLEKLKERCGSSYLIYGKSGIGKTELIREFHKGIGSQYLFLSAKCNRFTPNQPYSVYRQFILEFLDKIVRCDNALKNAVRHEIDGNLREHSGIICHIIPEARVLFESVAEIEMIDKEKEFDRIIHVLTNLITVICRNISSVIYVDDVQWIDRITLKILMNLLEQKVQSMVLCTFRTSTDEGDLYCNGIDLLNAGFEHHLPVHEFTLGETVEFIKAKFRKVGNFERLANALQEKTDGVPYVLSEAIRFLINNEMLVMNNNEWEYVGESVGRLPEKFDPVSLVLDKADKLSTEEKRVLQIASLVEGKFDELMLSELLNSEKEHINRMLMKIEAFGFLVNHFHGGFTFSHDKIQESLANDLSKKEKMVIYEKLGDLFFRKSEIERNKIFNAAEYFLKSDNPAEAAKACYSAAQIAITDNALDIAIKYLKNVSLLLRHATGTIDGLTTDIVKIDIMLGDVLMLTGANEQALSIFARIIAESRLDREGRLEIEYKIGTIYHNISEFELSSKYFIQSLSTIGFRIPSGSLKLLLPICREVLYQFFVSPWMAKIRPSLTDKHSAAVVKIFNKLSYSLYFNDMVKGYFVHFKALNLADRLPDCPEKAEAYTLHQIPVFQMTLKRRAFRYLRKAQEICARIKRPDTMAFAEEFGGMIHYYSAQWRKSQQMLRSCINRYNSIGDLNNQIASREHSWKVSHILGAVDTVTDEMVTTINICKKVKEKYFILVTQAAYNLCKFLKNGKHDFNEYLDIQSRLKNVKSLLFHIEVGGYLLNTELELGEHQKAFDRARHLLPLILRNSINSEYQVRGFSLFCYLIVRELHGRNFGVRKISIMPNRLKFLFVVNCCINLLSCLTFPAYWGAFHRNIAWFLMVHHQKKLAHAFFRKAIKAHHELDMRYEEACSIRDYGIFLEDYCGLPGDARDRFNDAYQLFKHCGVKLETDRLESRIGQDGNSCSTSTDFLADTGNVPIPESTSYGINALRFETLVDVSRTITETDDPAILLRQILSAMITATGAQYGCLFINKNAYDQFEPIAMSFEGTEVAIVEVPVFRDLIDKVNEIHTMQCSGENDLDESNDTDSTFIRSDLCVPLNWRDKYLGYVYLVNDRVRGLFGEGAQKAAMVLAAHAGILLENAALMSRQKQFTVELQRQVEAQTADIKYKHEQLEVANLKLIESERMKGILSGTLVHDIKNYSAGITGNLIYLDRRLENDPKAHRIIEVVVETCSDITSLASNLLDIAKMDDGKMVIREELLDAEFFCAMAEKFGVSTLFEEKGINPVIVPADPDFLVYADIYLVERVLQNLYSNAAKYAPRNSRVELRLYREGEECIVCFFNSGPPIPDSEKEILFEKYARIQSRQSPYSKGLGLFFCRMVMNAHGGRIWLDTDEDGNYFKLAFPVKQHLRLKAAS
jgi:serine/threonine protein kinase/signal transduction histidine kinase/tetratricopeptide (TPR) repeat protein